MMEYEFDEKTKTLLKMATDAVKKPGLETDK